MQAPGAAVRIAEKVTGGPKGTCLSSSGETGCACQSVCSATLNLPGGQHQTHSGSRAGGLGAGALSLHNGFESDCETLE